MLLLGTATLALALTGPGALAVDNLKLLPFERRFQERERAALIPSRG